MPDDVRSTTRSSAARATRSASPAATATACCSRCSSPCTSSSPAEQHRNLWGRFVISLVLGAVLLLAFHTSHVRSRAFTDRDRARRHGRRRQLPAGGVRTPRRRRFDVHHVRARVAGADRDPPPDHPARDRRPRDHPRRDLRLRAHRHRVRRHLRRGSTKPSPPASSPRRSSRTTSTSSTSRSSPSRPSATATSSRARAPAGAGDVRSGRRADLPRHPGGAPGQPLRQQATAGA